MASPRFWMRVDANWWQDPRMMAAGKDGVTLYLGALAYSHANELDGAIPEAVVALLSQAYEVVPGTVENLVDLGLWERNGKGWKVARGRYEAWQETTAERRVRLARHAQNERLSRARRDRSANDQ